MRKIEVAATPYNQKMQYNFQIGNKYYNRGDKIRIFSSKKKIRMLAIKVYGQLVTERKGNLDAGEEATQSIMKRVLLYEFLEGYSSLIIRYRMTGKHVH